MDSAKYCIRIPTSEEVESLNVGVAAGIVLYSFRQNIDMFYLSNVLSTDIFLQYKGLIAGPLL